MTKDEGRRPVLPVRLRERGGETLWTRVSLTGNGTRMNDDENPHLDRPLRSFGRIKARPIKPRQAALMDSLLPMIAVPDP